MLLGTRRAGTSTSFIDSECGELLLSFTSDHEGNTRVAFCLYDARGTLVDQNESPQTYPEGLTVRDEAGELLLDLPSKPDAPVQYRLFNKTGRLLTWSDGARTQIFGLLRMEHAAAPLVRNTTPASSS
jgi:hypothetical protein